VDRGCRATELVNLTTDDVNLDDSTVRLVGKGKQGEQGAGGALAAKTIHALNRYLRTRRQHLYRDMPRLWIGERGRITD
jgi:site-specific recombinase XerD